MLSLNEARRILYKDGLQLGPVRGRVADLDVEIGGGRVDFLIDLTWEGQTRHFVAEYQRGSTPKEIEAALAQARRLVEGSPDLLLPMVIAPYLSNKMIDRLIQQGISGIDLSGNAAVIVPGAWLVVLTGKPNRYPSSAPIKAVYGGTSSLVGRVLLSCPEYQMVKGVLQEIERRGGKVSLPTVSKVLKALEDDLIVVRDPEIRLVQPERLLDQLAEHYVAPEVRERRPGQMQLTPEVYQTLVANAKNAQAQIAGRSEVPYVISWRTGPRTIYTSAIDDILRGIAFKPGQRFANVEFVETDDPRVYFDARQDEEFLWVSPLQIYLELSQGGKREREIAQSLRDDLVNFRYA